MKTLAIMSQKGGSGKTTLAVHLAAYAVGQKIKTALIDLDPQASAYKWNERRTEDDPQSPKLDAIKGTVTQLAGFLKLAEHNGIALDSYRYESLEPLFELSSRVKIEMVA